MTGKEKILDFLKNSGPATDEDIARTLDMNPSSARTRRVELEREGLVRAVGRALTKSGRLTYLWDAAIY